MAKKTDFSKDAPRKARTEIDWYKVLVEAFQASKNAEADFIKKYGEPMYCGFAWVNIRPGNHPIVKVLKTNFPQIGHKGHPTGWDVWNPGGSGTQSMDVKECGAEAFANVLRKNGVVCYAQSRAD